jgi:AcrR family transcriptional regulator
MGSLRRKKPTRPRLKAEVRRVLIVEAAFKAVAEHGFEGLRTRDIAGQVGINSATLHHHFATKEDLIAAVADHLESRLRTEKSQRAQNEQSSALATFDGQFEDVIRYQLEEPEILAVYREFVGRSPRDPGIHALVIRLHDGWRSSMIDALTRGKQDGSLRPDLDVEAAAGLIVSTVWGLVSNIFGSKAELEAAARQLRSWLVFQTRERRAERGAATGKKRRR